MDVLHASPVPEVENAMVFATGFEKALEQVRLLHGDLKFSASDPFKVIEDGKIVDDE